MKSPTKSFKLILVFMFVLFAVYVIKNQNFQETERKAKFDEKIETTETDGKLSRLLESSLPTSSFR